MFLTSVIIAVWTVVFIGYIVKFAKYWKFFNSLPGEKSFHLLYGNLHTYPGPNEEGMAHDMEMTRKYRTFHRFWAGPVMPVIVCYHSQTVKALLKSSAPKPRNRWIASPYDMGVQWLGEGLLISNGHKWSRNRRLLTPAFHFDILKSYMGIYNECSMQLLKKLKALSEKGEEFDIFGPISLSSLDVILQCAFSYKSDCQTSSSPNEYETALVELAHLWTDRTFLPHLFIDFIYNLTSSGRRFSHLCNVVHEIAESIIKRRKDTLEKNEGVISNTKVRDFLDTLLTARDEDGRGLSMRDIRDEVDTFLFEGHDTTTSGMAWTLYALAQHPEYQDKVYQEVAGVLNGRDQLEWKELGNLEFTTMCIKEALRIHSAVPFIERKLTEPLEIDGHMIPEGTFVAVQIWMLHNNPHIWDDPETFNPYRFSPENQSKMDPFQFLPFSAGSRNCIGQNFAMNEMRVTVAQVLRHFKVSVDPQSAHARRRPCITMRTEKGAMVTVTPR